ncbi:MAG: hypothetical protein ACJAYN_001307 [Bermanella sp.]|jgi:hypothetical protein
MNKQQLSMDYFMAGLRREYQTSPFLILALTGRLNSHKGGSLEIISMFALNDGEQIITDAFVLFDCIATMKVKPSGGGNIIQSCGTPFQCINYLVSQFQQALNQQNDSIYCESAENPSFTDIELFNGEK